MSKPIRYFISYVATTNGKNMIFGNVTLNTIYKMENSNDIIRITELL
jgi:hypothetical protein